MITFDHWPAYALLRKTNKSRTDIERVSLWRDVRCKANSRQPGRCELALQKQIGGHLRPAPKRAAHTRCLDQRFAVITDPFVTHMALNGKHAGRVVQLLADVLTDALEYATTLAVLSGS